MLLSVVCVPQDGVLTSSTSLRCVRDNSRKVKLISTTVETLKRIYIRF